MEKNSEQFCRKILGLKIPRRKALANLVMALAGNTNAGSPVQLSLAPCYFYQYSSIGKAVDHLAHSAEEWAACAGTFRRTFCSPLVNLAPPDKFHVLQLDTTPVSKPHSPTLDKRKAVYVPNNPVPGNAPVNIGYEVSFANYSAGESKWSLPLSARLVDFESSAIGVGVEQVRQLLQAEDLPFKRETTLCASDNKYAQAPFLAPLHELPTLVNVVRLRSSQKVWTQSRRTDTGGAPQVYGEQFYLIPASDIKTYHRQGKEYPVERRSVLERDSQEEHTWEETTAKGRLVRIHLQRFNDLMLRSKRGFNMKDKPFDLLVAQVSDARSGEPVFQKPMYLGLWNARKAEVPAPDGYKAYRSRYDIEPFNAFAKRRLLLQAFQSCVRQHLENWLLVILLAMSLLYVASTEVAPVCHKWEQYAPAFRQQQQQGTAAAPERTTGRLSMFNACKAAYRLFSTFDLRPFFPHKSKKLPPGRQKGDTQTPRPLFKPLFKPKRKTKQKWK